MASSDIKAIVPAAYGGRVASLFVAADRYQWGRIDPRTRMVSVHEQAACGNEDLLVLAAMQTLLDGGAVYTDEQKRVPGETAVATLFRY